MSRVFCEGERFLHTDFSSCKFIALTNRKLLETDFCVRCASHIAKIRIMDSGPFLLLWVCDCTETLYICCSTVLLLVKTVRKFGRGSSMQYYASEQIFPIICLSQKMRSRTQNAEKVIFNNKIKQRTKTTPKGKNKQAGRRLEHSQTFNSHETHERQRISTGLQTQGDYIGRQTRVTMETQLEPLKQWLSNKMGGDRQSTWEHMAPNKQQAMCSTHRDIWWPAWAHQQDRDITPPLRSGSQTLHTH